MSDQIKRNITQLLSEQLSKHPVLHFIKQAGVNDRDIYNCL